MNKFKKEGKETYFIDSKGRSWDKNALQDLVDLGEGVKLTRENSEYLDYQYDEVSDKQLNKWKKNEL
jgi:hypothetical protein